MIQLMNTTGNISPNVAAPIGVKSINVTPTATVPPKGSFWGGVASTVTDLAKITTTAANAYSQVRAATQPIKNSVTPTVYNVGNQAQPGAQGGYNTPILPNTYVTINPDGTQRLIDEGGETLAVGRATSGINTTQIAVIAAVVLGGFLLLKGGK